MYTEGFEQFIKASKSVPFQEWNRASLGLLRRTFQQQCEIMSDNFALMSEQCKRYSQAKNADDFGDLLNLHRHMLSEDLNAMMRSFQRSLQNSMENLEELTKLYGTTMRDQTAAATHAVQKEREREKEREHK